ncbi:MAG: PAS domain S-box protein, partial [Candidatus Sericytochromatia bacterium]
MSQEEFQKGQVPEPATAREVFHEFMAYTDDLLTRVDAEGRFTFVNHAAERFFGLSPEQCLGRSAYDFVHPEDRERTRRDLEACLAARRSDCTFENRQVSVSGEVRDVLWNAHVHLDDAGRAASLTSIARDITEQKRAWEVHDRFQRALLSLTKQQAFSGNDLNAALQAISETAAHALAVDRVGVWLFRDNFTRVQCVHLYLRPENRHEVGPEISAAEAPRYFEALEQDRVITADDTAADARTQELAAYLSEHGIGAMLDAPIHTDGTTSGIVCHEHVGGPRAWTLEEQSFAASIGDIIAMVIGQSERRRVELEMLRQTLELEKANELSRMKSEFINTVAHELRTPLTSVIGLAEFLEEGIGGELTADQQTHVRQMLSNMHRLARLVDDLMDMARMQVGTFQLAPQEVDMVELIEANVAGLAPQAEAASVEVLFEPPAARPVLQADPVRLAQVLSNLLTNAIKFTPAGGRVTVRLQDEGDHARVEVADTGIAIAPEDIPKLFQRFTQLE